MTADAINELWEAYRSAPDREKRDRLILHYSPLVKYVAGRVAAGLPQNVEQADLVSYGIFGLIDAIEKFDPERGFKFETYAISRIKGAILDGLRSIDWVPRSVRARGRDVERAFSKLEAKLHRSPTEPELAEATSRGRIEEFARMGWDRSEVPNPQDPETFRRSKLEWQDLDFPEHQRLLVEHDALAREQVRDERAGLGAHVELDGPLAVAEDLVDVLQDLPALEDQVGGRRRRQLGRREPGHALHLPVPAHVTLAVVHVERPGEAVQDGVQQAPLLLETDLGRALLGLVAHDLQEADHLAAPRPHGVQDAVDPHSRAVPADVPAVVPGLAPLARGGDLGGVGAAGPVLRREDDGARAADELVLLEAEEHAHAGVPRGDDAGAVEGEDRVAAEVGDGGGEG